MALVIVLNVKKKSMKKYYKIIRLGMMPYDILVCQGMSTMDVKEYIKKKFKVDILNDKAFEHHDKRQGKTIFLGTNQTIIWLKHKPTNPRTIGTLAHEAMHAMNFIGQIAGIDWHDSSEEFFTYGVEYIMEQVLKDFIK